MAQGNGKLKRGLWLQNGTRLGVKEVVEHAIAAEEAGWDGIFVSDSISDGYSDPITPLAAIAAQTNKITLGTWLIPVPTRFPWRLAHTLASLDRLSDGRLLLGVGLGTPREYEMFGGTYDPTRLGRRYDEALDLIVQLWSGERVNYDGEFFTVSEGRLPVVPVQQPRIPIVMGCWWPHKKPFRRAARWDGIMPVWPALWPQGEGPQGETPTGSVEEELHALMDYYIGFTDDPGEVILPDRDDAAYRELCQEVGATWLLTDEALDLDAVRRGPQG